MSPTTRMRFRPLALWLFIFPASLLLSPANLTGQTAVTVSTLAGTLEGRSGDGVERFLGIPFAAPPVGELRWRPPHPVTPWTGTRSATGHAPDCIQKPVAGDAAPLGGDMSEDCLYLNVWRPTGSPGPHPIMVWIPGGGFVNGGTSTPIFDGSALAREGIVVVSLNYRLGRLGFFAHPALTAEQEPPHANYGYMDQLAALGWIQREIAAFGGDPDRVTLVGESAGGQSVLDHLTMPAARGLFHGAVIMSGGGRTLLGGFPLREGTRRWPSAEDIGMEFAGGMGIRGTGPEALASLRALSAEQVVQDANLMAILLTAVLPLGPVQFVRGPVVDGTLVTGEQDRLIAGGAAADVPIMIGSNSGDLGTWLPLSKRRFFASFGAEEPLARHLYDPDGDGDLLPVVFPAAADRTMHEPARFVAREMTSAGNPVYLYRFSYVADSEREESPAAGHASELPFLFGTLDARFGTAVTERDRALSRAFLRYVANFVRTGDPNGPGLPAWEAFGLEGTEIMDLASDGTPRMVADPLTERLDLMERMARDQPRPLTVAELARPDWKGFLAVGAIHTPEHLGSSAYRTWPFPMAEVSYRNRAFASIGTTGRAAALGAHLFDDRVWRLSAIVGLSDRREEANAETLAGMGDRGFGMNGGVVLARRQGLVMQSLTVSRGLTDGAGTRATLGAALFLPTGLSGALTAGVSASWADAREMRHDFGVNASQAARRRELVELGDPRLAPGADALFLPGAGMQEVKANAAWVRLLGDRWMIVALGSAGRLVGEAADSPLTERRWQFTTGAGLGMRF